MTKDRKNLYILIILIIVMTFLIALFGKFVVLELYYRDIDTKYAEKIYEKNKKTVFRISKIINHSSADAIDNTDTLQDFDINQFSDISIHIDNHYEIKELTDENTIKELYIDNFKIELPDNALGEIQSLYYKNPYNIGKYRKLDFNKIDNKLEYDIIYKNEENKPEFYDSPVFYTDCSNPITISYINEKIYKNYSVQKNSSISYDGRILKDIGIKLNQLSPKISFTIHVKNNLNEEFVCSIVNKIPLENNEGTIYSGYFAEIQEGFEKQYKFYKM